MEEAEHEIQGKQELDEVVRELCGEILLWLEGCDVGLREGVVGRHDEHEVVEEGLPGAVELDDEAVEVISLVLVALGYLLEILVCEVHVHVLV